MTVGRMTVGRRLLSQVGLPQILGFLCALCLVLLVRSPANAQGQAISRATLTQVLDSPQVFIQDRQAKVKDTASRGQRVRTGTARAQLTFNTGAVGRLAHNSVLTVGQCAQIQRGTLLVNGAMNACTSSIVAGVRGTTYVLSVNEAGAAEIDVLEGTVTVSRLGANASRALGQRPDTDRATTDREPLPTPTRAEARSIEPPKVPAPDRLAMTLTAGEKVIISPLGALGVIQKLTQTEFRTLLRGELFKGFPIPLPGTEKIRQSFQRLFPGVPFPLSTPSLPIPRLPIPTLPSIPIHLPF